MEWPAHPQLEGGGGVSIKLKIAPKTIYLFLIKIDLKIEFFKVCL